MNVTIDKWFANPIWEIPLDLDTSELIPYFYNLKDKNPGVGKSNKGGWQCSDIVTPPESYTKLLDQIDRALIIVHQSLGLKTSTPSYVKESSLHEIFEHCDLITFHVPLTSETKYMCNQEFIYSFKKTNY
jgi:hypothetical protein